MAPSAIAGGGENVTAAGKRTERTATVSFGSEGGRAGGKKEVVSERGVSRGALQRQGEETRWLSHEDVGEQRSEKDKKEGRQDHGRGKGSIGKQNDQ